jgi:hypothetical protein
MTATRTCARPPGGAVRVVPLARSGRCATASLSAHRDHFTHGGDLVIAHGIQRGHRRTHGGPVLVRQARDTAPPTHGWWPSRVLRARPGPAVLRLCRSMHWPDGGYDVGGCRVAVPVGRGDRAGRPPTGRGGAVMRSLPGRGRDLLSPGSGPLTRNPPHGLIDHRRVGRLHLSPAPRVGGRNAGQWRPRVVGHVGSPN